MMMAYKSTNVPADGLEENCWDINGYDSQYVVILY